MTSSTPKTSLAHDLQRLQFFAKLFLVCGALAFAVHRPALAQAFPATTSGSTSTFGGGAHNSAAVAAGAAAVIAGGVVAVAQNKTIRTAAGAAIGVAVRGIPAVGAIGAAAKACLNSPACAVATAAAAAALANEIGYTYGVDASGAPTVTKPVGAGCTVALGNGRRFTSLDGICLNALKMHIADGGITDQHQLNCPRTVSNPTAPCQFKGSEWWMSWNDAGTDFPPPPAGATAPSSVNELADAIDTKKDYSSSSKAPAFVDELAKNGKAIPLQPPTSITIDKPTVYDVPTVTTSAPDAAGNTTRTTTTTSTTATANPPSVTLTSGSVTQTQQVAADGTASAPVTTGTTTGGTHVAPPVEQVEPCTGADAGTVGCAAMDTPSGEIPKSTKTIPFNAENTGLGSGQCPAPIQMNTSKGNYQIDLAPYCSALTNYVKPVLLLIAAFAAFAICVPKGADI